MNASSTHSEHRASDPTPSDGSVLIAGGTGFIGSAVVGRLSGKRPTVVLSRAGERARGRLAGVPGGGDVEIRKGDVTAPETLAPALAGIDTIVQCVQFPGSPVEDPSRGRTFLDVDATGTTALVEAARAAGVRKIVYVSGVGADIESDKVWFRAKGIAERAVSESGLAFSIVRPSWTFGPGDQSLNRFVDIIKWMPLAFPQLGPGSQRINPVLVDDVGRLVAQLVTGDAGDSATLEIGGREILSMDEIIEATMNVLGRRKPIIHAPLSLVKLGAGLLELFPGQLLSRDAVDFITASAVADLGALDALLPDFELTPFEDALSAYL
jgi:NADH dehydrogenase